MDREYIYIFKGDDTNWNNERFVTVNVTAQTGVDLSGMTAKFMLGSYTKEYPLTTGSFKIDLSAAITGKYAFGPICGTIQILDSEGRIKTACNTIPFYITDKVIAEQHQTLDIDLPQGSPVSINLSVGGTVSYNDLADKPSLNGVTIESAKTSADYGLQPVGDYATQTQLEEGLANKQDIIADLVQIRSNANLGATAVQPGTLDTELSTKQDKLNSSQLAAVNSGITSTGVAQAVSQINTNANNIASLQNSKQDVIADLSDIRAGSSAGATALQPATAAATYVPLTQKAAANGVATLDANTLIPTTQLPTIDGGNANA